MAVLNFPDNPPDGDTYNYDDGSGRVVTYTYDATNDTWTGPIIKTTSLIQPTSDDVTVSGRVNGLGTEEDPYVLRSSSASMGGMGIISPHKITISNQIPGKRVAFSNMSANSGRRFQQPVGTVNGSGQYITHLQYKDAPRSNVRGIKYAGLFRIGSVYFSWLVSHDNIPAVTPTPTPGPTPTEIVITSPSVTPTPTPAVVASVAIPSVNTANFFNVSVKLKTGLNHTYGLGSLKAYYINGTEAYTLVFTKGTTYRFNQSDSSNLAHPLRFYTDEAKTTLYTSGVVTNGIPGEVGAFTQITIPSDAPATLYYQCQHHGYMGGKITIQ